MAYSQNFEALVLAGVNDLITAEKVAFSEMLFEKSIQNSAIADSHILLTGIENGTTIPILTKGLEFGAMPFSDPNDCTSGECSITTKFSSHKWELGFSECNLTICLKTFTNNFYKFLGTTKDYAAESSFGEFEATALAQLIKNELDRALLGSQWTKAYFGDKAATTNTLINGINGFFTQAQANPSQIVPILENTQTTFSGQQFSSGQRVYDILVEMDRKYIVSDWCGTPGMEIKMTKLTAQTLVGYLNGLKEKDCCDGVERVNPDGLATRNYTFDNLVFRGIPIKIIREWDEIINHPAIGLSPAGVNAAKVKPHRILMTYKENLLLATSAESNFKTFAGHYDFPTNKIMFRIGTFFGAGIPMKNEYILAI